MAGMAPPGGGAGGAFKVGAKFMDGKYTYYFTINQVGLDLRVLKLNFEILLPLFLQNCCTICLAYRSKGNLLAYQPSLIYCKQGYIRIFRNNATRAKAAS